MALCSALWAWLVLLPPLAQAFHASPGSLRQMHAVVGVRPTVRVWSSTSTSTSTSTRQVAPRPMAPRNGTLLTSESLLMDTADVSADAHAVGNGGAAVASTKQQSMPSLVMEILKEQPVDDAVGALLRSINPKLMRIWTKADFLHAHAISGVVFMAGGSIWQLLRVAEAFQHPPGSGSATGEAADALLHSPLASDSAMAFFLMLTGFINALTAVPMARFSSNKVLDLSDLKANGFSLGGTGLTSMCLWLAWWFSGTYPERLHALDAALVAVFSLLCVATTVNWEVMLQQNFGSGARDYEDARPSDIPLETVVVVEQTEAAAALVPPSTTRTPRSRSQRKLGMATTQTKIWLYRIASWPNLTQILFMSSIALGSAEWLAHISERYSEQPRVLFDYAFSSALGYSLSMFAETLRDRKLIGLQADFAALLVGVLAPMLVVAADCAAGGSAAEINPAAYWQIFGAI